MDRREALYGLIGLAGSRGILRGADPTQRLDLGGASLEVYISSDNFVPGNMSCASDLLPCLPEKYRWNFGPSKSTKAAAAIGSAC